MKRFLVTGCPRSGTGYAAALFRALGVRCGHENVFAPDEALGRRPVDWNGYDGEASWLAAPLLPLEDIVVLHQVRHPLDVIRSIVGIRFLGAQHSEVAVPFRNVVRRYAPEVFAPNTEAERAALLWQIWNAKAEAWAALTYRLEDLDAELLHRLARLVELELSEEQAKSAVASTPRDINHRRRDETVSWKAAGPVLEKLAARYGY
jgi:hypothetical protein